MTVTDSWDSSTLLLTFSDLLNVLICRQVLILSWKNPHLYFSFTMLFSIYVWHQLRKIFKRFLLKQTDNFFNSCFHISEVWVICCILWHQLSKVFRSIIKISSTNFISNKQFLLGRYITCRITPVSLTVRLSYLVSAIIYSLTDEQILTNITQLHKEG